MTRFVLIPFVFMLSACVSTGGGNTPVTRSAPVIADHPDARLAAAIAAELEARTGEPALLSGARAEMDALAAALWGQPQGAAPAVEAMEPDVIPPGRSVLYGVHIASYRTLDHAQQGWMTMRAMLPDVLGPLEPRVEEADLGERGLYLRLKAGPFATPEAAAETCARLAESAIYCQAMAFSGETLAAESEN